MKAKLYGVALSLLVLCGGFGLIYYQTHQEAGVVVYDSPPAAATNSIGGDFELTDTKGHKRSTTEFRGKYLLVYFGYTFCPDICPTALSNISDALKILGRDREQVVPLFVTIDPKRDTVENLAIYASNFHPSIVMLTGSEDALKSVQKKFKVYAAVAPDDGKSSEYLMDHSTLIYLMDKEGHFLAHFPHTVDPKELAEAIRIG